MTGADYGHGLDVIWLGRPPPLLLVLPVSDGAPPACLSKTPPCPATFRNSVELPALVSSQLQSVPCPLNRNHHGCSAVLALVLFRRALNKHGSSTGVLLHLAPVASRQCSWLTSIVASVALATPSNVTSLRGTATTAAPHRWLSGGPALPTKFTVSLSKHVCDLAFTYELFGTGAMATAEFTVTMKHIGYVAFGFGSDDEDGRGAMNGSYAVIAKQTKGVYGEHALDVAEYSISGYSESSIVRQPTQNLRNLKLTQVGGVTTAGSTIMQFGRLLQTGDSADYAIDRDGASTVHGGAVVHGGVQPCSRPTILTAATAQAILTATTAGVATAPLALAPSTCPRHRSTAGYTDFSGGSLPAATRAGGHTTR